MSGVQPVGSGYDGCEGVFWSQQQQRSAMKTSPTGRNPAKAPLVKAEGCMNGGFLSS